MALVMRSPRALALRSSATIRHSACHPNYLRPVWRTRAIQRLHRIRPADVLHLCAHAMPVLDVRAHDDTSTTANHCRAFGIPRVRQHSSCDVVTPVEPRSHKSWPALTSVRAERTTGPTLAAPLLSGGTGPTLAQHAKCLRICAPGECNRIEPRRKNLSGSWHSGRSQHGQYLGYTGSSVRDMPHLRHSNQLNPEPLQ